MSPILELIGGVKGYGWSSFVNVPNSFESIATVVSTGSSGNVTFSSIPQTYKHLQLCVMLRTNDGGSWNNQAIRFNGDTASNYAIHRFYGDGGTATAGAATNIGSINDFMRAAGTSITSNVFGVSIMDILDYANTSKFKTIRMLNGGDGNGNGWIGLHSGLWRSTSAITSFELDISGGTASQYSHFALYGIKGAENASNV